MLDVRVLVRTGDGKTTGCAICHGPTLQGMADVPPLAGRHPNYIVRQLWNVQNGERAGKSSAQMQAVVAASIADFAKFPPRQKPAAFNLDAVLAQVTHHG